MPDRVVAHAEGDRNGRGRSLGRKRDRIPDGSDDGHAAADEIDHERWQPIELATQPVVLDENVLALDIACFTEAFAEGEAGAHRAVERATAHKADRWYGRLLRMHSKRPRRRAAEQRDELASPHEDPLSPEC